MPTLAERVAEFVPKNPGLTDREIADTLLGRAAPQQGVNQVCRRLAEDGVIARTRRSDNLIGNFPLEGAPTPNRTPITRTANKTQVTSLLELNEDELKRALQGWLLKDGWTAAVAWGRTPGVDIAATRAGERWLIEVKGAGSRPAMRVNYFLGALGELLQRMDDDRASYSIALPDLPQFRGLWERLPSLAKRRMGISALFVDARGNVKLEN